MHATAWRHLHERRYAKCATNGVRAGTEILLTTVEVEINQQAFRFRLPTILAIDYKWSLRCIRRDRLPLLEVCINLSNTCFWKSKETT